MMIDHFSLIAAPLTKLTSIKREFVWSNEAQTAFEQLKHALKTALLLASPNFDKPFRIATDASKDGLGAVLQQDGHPIAYASRTCSPAEQNYQATEQEALAVIWAIRHCKHYVYGRDIEICTDHKPFHDLKKNRHPDEPLGRLMLKLQGMNHRITYMPGDNNKEADVLSRDVAPAASQSDLNPEIEMRESDLPVNNNAIEFVDIDWIALQSSDPGLKRVAQAIKDNKRNISFSEYRRYFAKTVHRQLVS
jgi:hypothetical protein